jgi:hypothetical protein
MSARLSVTAQLNALLRDMPGPFAPVGVRVSWTRRKAGLLWRIAEESDCPDEAAQATVLARLAEQSADRLAGGR